jgi:cell division protease FtsH
LNDLLKNVLLWVVIAVILVAVFNNLGGQAQMGNQISYSEFINDVKTGQVETATISGREITGRLRGSSGAFNTYSPETDNRSLIGELLDAGVEIKAEPPENPNFLLQLLLNTFPFLDLFHAPDAGRWRWSRCDVVWQEQGSADERRPG